jgi:hypothetical protein
VDSVLQKDVETRQSEQHFGLMFSDIETGPD